MLCCSIWFCAPSFWMGGGLESRCVGRVCGVDVAVRLESCVQCGCCHATEVAHPSKNSLHKTICCNTTSTAPDDGRMYPRHVELRIY